MTTISMDIKGINKIQSQMKRYGEIAEAALTKSLKEEANGILIQSKELVPVATGALRDSGKVTGPIGNVISIKFGGGNVNYAAAVHEIIDAWHTNGMAKFLEIPARKAISGMSKRIAKDIKIATKSLKR